MACDYPLSFTETCDAPICPRCSVSVGDDVGYCDWHKARKAQQ